MLGQAEKWVVLRGGRDKFISVGSSDTYIQPSGHTGMSDANVKKRMHVVCFGEPIVLQNIHTGLVHQ
eukprot:1579797-Ditylum_brightwellii.AAC.1